MLGRSACHRCNRLLRWVIDSYKRAEAVPRRTAGVQESPRRNIAIETAHHHLQMR